MPGLMLGNGLGFRKASQTFLGFCAGGATGMDVTILLPGSLLRNCFVIDSIGTQKSAL